MKEFEMRFHWDDREEAYYRKTETHRQDGMLKTWKLDRETDEQYQERTRELIRQKHRFLHDVRSKMCGRFANVDSYKFR